MPDRLFFRVWVPERDQVCLGCGGDVGCGLPASVAADGGDSFRPGEKVMCIHCAHFMKLDERGALVDLLPHEWGELRAMPRWGDVEKLREQIQTLRRNRDAKG